MKAKCYKCFGEKPDCNKCNGTGFVEASIASGEVYTRHCTNPDCGFDNGGMIVGPTACPKEALDSPPSPCLYCNSKAEWKLVGTWE
jgi:hypothetical protein